MAMLFTPDSEEARLHYVADGAVRSYVVCPGAGCPLCFCGSEPTVAHLLPVYDAESGQVKVLRIPARRQPNGLGPLLVPHLRDRDVASKVLLIRRDGHNYSVEARRVAETANRGEQQIATFRADREAGLTLESAFPRMTPEELSEVPAIATKLDTLGGWEPPATADSKRNTDNGNTTEA